MAKRMIVKAPDEILLKKSRHVEAFDKRLASLLDDMKDTLVAKNGAGLAAPQLAILKRIAVVSTEDGYFELVNPVIENSVGEQMGIEGCLSVPGKYGTVTRAEKIVVSAQDRMGNPKKYNVEGFTARAFLHEIDHLDGILYTTKCTDLQDD